MALPLFFKRLRYDLGLEFLFKVHLLEAPILLFQFFEPRHHGDIHPAVFGSPLVERGRADPQFTAHIWHPNTRINPFQRLHDLAIAVSGLLHIEPFPLEKILLLVPTLYWDDYRWRGYDGLVDIGVDRHFRVNHGNNEFVRGSKHVNGIESFWSYAKHRLAQFHGVAKHTFAMHLKETEFRFNHRHDNLYRALLKLLRARPL